MRRNIIVTLVVVLFINFTQNTASARTTSFLFEVEVEELGFTSMSLNTVLEVMRRFTSDEAIRMGDIEEGSHFPFVYKYDPALSTKELTLRIDKGPLASALDKICKEAGITYHYKDGMVYFEETTSENFEKRK